MGIVLGSAVVFVGAALGSIVWKGAGWSWLYKRTEPSVDAVRKTLRWKGEKRAA